MSEREIQKTIREVKKTLAKALKDFVYDKKIDKAHFLRKLNEIKGMVDQLMIKVSEDVEEVEESEKVIEE